MDENDRSSPYRKELKKIADWLSESSKIGYCRNSYDQHPRCIKLHKQEIFDSLVKLYASAMFTHRHHFRIILNSYTSIQEQLIYAARCYISMWFIDLYVSNRNALKEVCLQTYHEHYYGNLYLVSHDYDRYLTLLNASIRPTYIKHGVENVLYIPVISDSTDVRNSNPFGIKNFVSVSSEVSRNIARIIRDNNLWHLTPLSSDKMGRPCWLFDWHTDNRVCSWFSQKDNFDHGDVTLAYILGTACTPNLGFRDVDDWQYFDKATVPKNLNPLHYNRVAERRFYGAYEVRTMEIDADFSLSALHALVNHTTSATTAKRSVQAQEPDQLMPRFRLTDWVYHCRVVLHMDDDTRFITHTGLLQKKIVG